MENISHAIGTDMFVDEKFFNEDNLAKFINAKKIERLENNADFLMASEIAIPDIGNLAIIKNSDGEKGAVGLSISFKTKKIGMDDLFKRFGPLADVEEIYAKYNPIHPFNVERTTHIMGHLETRHFLSTNKSNTEIIILFAGNGSIARMNIRQAPGSLQKPDGFPLSEPANVMLENARRNGLSHDGYNALISASRRSPLLSSMLEEAAKRTIRISMGKAGEGSYFQNPTLFIDPKLVPGAPTGLFPDIFAGMVVHHLSHALQENPVEVSKKTLPTTRETILSQPMDPSKIPISAE